MSSGRGQRLHMREHGERSTRSSGAASGLANGVMLDGFVAGPGGEGDWGFRRSIRTYAHGRSRPCARPERTSWDASTYGQMAAYWPAATGDCAPPMNNIPKVVFSKRLPTAEWISSRIARGDLTEETTALKSESGGDIIAHGGATFVQALSRLRLIDEYRLVVLPVALGSGLPLFRDLAGPLRLDLVEARRFPAGRPSTSTRRSEARSNQT
jgi:dihydrofolate reductase